jgi:hypothetical protein
MIVRCDGNRHSFDELVLFWLFTSFVFGALLSATALWIAELLDMGVYLTSGTCSLVGTYVGMCQGVE